jgi:hypothetical protein
MIRDESSVLVETYTDELRITSGAGVAEYVRVFGRLATVAKYGRDAFAVLSYAAGCWT